jgi:hypothetical protein
MLAISFTPPEFLKNSTTERLFAVALFVSNRKGMPQNFIPKALKMKKGKRRKK